MIPLTLAEVAELVGGQRRRRRPATSWSPARPSSTAALPSRAGCSSPSPASTSTATTTPPAAVGGGAAAVLGTPRRPACRPCVVDDAQAALQELARAGAARGCASAARGPTRRRVTGSQGKTTAKDMLARVLADAGADRRHRRVLQQRARPAAHRAARRRASTRYLVLEMGARGIGHLAELCAIAPPDISLVLNVGKAHIGEFGSQEQHRAWPRASSSRRCGPDGAAVLNLDDPLVAAMARAHRGPGLDASGAATGADVRLDGVEVDDLGRPSFDLTHGGATEHVALRLLGEHQATNAAAAAAAALAAGLPLADVAASLRAIERLSPLADGAARARRRPGGRQRRLQRQPRLDARRAGDARRGWAASGRRARSRCSGRCASSATPPTRSTARSAARPTGLGIDEVVVVGRGRRGRLRRARRGARRRTATTRHVETVDEAGDWLRENVAGPDVVLVKASRSGRLERVAEMLVDRTARRTDDPGERRHRRESDPAGRRPVAAAHPRRAPATPSACWPRAATAS